MAEKINGLTYGLVTTVVGLEIHQALTREDPADRLSAEVSRWMFDTREDGVRNALIQLGWTPPATEVVRAVPQPVEFCRHQRIKTMRLFEDPLVDAGCVACGMVRRGDRWEELHPRKAAPAPAPIERPEVLEICKHEKSITFMQSSQDYRCDVCGERLTQSEVQKIPSRSLRGFPYG